MFTTTQSTDVAHTVIECRKFGRVADQIDSINGRDKILRSTRNFMLGTSRITRPLDQLTSGLSGKSFHIAFYRRSMRVRIGTHDPVVVTPNEVTFHRPGETCVREALTEDGGEYQWIAVEPGPLSATCYSILADKTFPVCAPLKPDRFFAQRMLFTAFSYATSASASRALERAICDFVQNVLLDAVAHQRDRYTENRSQRPTCIRRRLQIAEDTKLLLAREFLSDISFGKVADSVHCSQSHLGRAFYCATGLLPGDYRRELRLRKGLFLMEDTRSDIGDIAIHVGFSSHSHFTAAFHRSFGSTPTEFVRWRARPILVSPATAAA